MLNAAKALGTGFVDCHILLSPGIVENGVLVIEILCGNAYSVFEK